MKTVILAAGFGSRLWPISTSEKPKQFQPLINGESLLHYSYRQLSKAIPVGELYVLTLEGLEAQVYEQLPGIDAEHIIAVPERRNTLPHTLMALSVLGGSPDEPILFKSVDHFIRDVDPFISSLTASLERYDRSRPAITLLCNEYQSFDPNDGYLIADSSHRITKYLEKPTQDAVESLLKDNKVYSSPFIYIASKAALLVALGNLEPEWAKTGQKLLQADAAHRKQAFLNMPLADISNTLFSGSKDLKLDIIQYDFLDVGKYDALYELNQKDPQGNVVLGNVVLGEDCKDNFIVNQTPPPLVVILRNNSVIVQTSAGSLVTTMEAASKVGEIYKNQIHRNAQHAPSRPR